MRLKASKVLHMYMFVPEELMIKADKYLSGSAVNAQSRCRVYNLRYLSPEPRHAFMSMNRRCIWMIYSDLHQSTHPSVQDDKYKMEKLSQLNYM